MNTMNSLLRAGSRSGAVWRRDSEGAAGGKPAFAGTWARPVAALLATGTLALAGGCTNAHYAKSADKAAYGLIRGQGAGVRNMDQDFTIEQAPKAPLDAYPTVAAAAEYLGEDGNGEAGAHLLSLDNSLQLAVRYSRAFQSRKEQLYLSALSLSLTRHQFTPIFSGSASGTYTETQQKKVITEIDAATGLPLPTVQLTTDERITASGSVGAGWLVRDAGRITQAELGRNEQQELKAELGWLNAIRTYRTQLDNFKIQLGLSVDSNIVLDDRELSTLAIGDVDIGLDEAIQVALAGRMDYQNVKDRFEDAVRRLELAGGARSSPRWISRPPP
jgi:hypothetical protein